MTDHDMDARLRGAGDRWRQENTPADAEDSRDELLVQLPPPRLRHRWLTAASAAIVTAALVLGGLYFLRHDDGGNGRPVAGPAATLIGPTWTDPATGQTIVFSTSKLQTRFLCTKTAYALRIDGDQLSVGDALGLPVECSYPDPGPAKQAGLEASSRVLTGTVRWSIERNTLTLSKPGAGSITLTRPVELTDLTGADWGIAGSPISMVFSDATVHIDDGCTDATYRARLSGAELTRSGMVGAGSSCGGPVSSDVVAHFDAITTGAFTVTLDANTLTLSKRGAGSITLTSRGTPPALVGPTWALAGIDDGNGNPLSHVNTSTRFRIDTDGTLTAADQCGNTITGKVDTTDTTFTFRGDIQLTAIGCADRVLNTGASLIDQIVSGTVAWSIRGTHLILANSAHPGLLTYDVAAPIVTPQPPSLPGTTWVLASVETTSNTANGVSSSATATTTWTLRFGADSFTMASSCFVITGTAGFAGATFDVTDANGATPPNVRCDYNRAYVSEQQVLAKLLGNGAVGVTRGGDGLLRLAQFNVVGVFELAVSTHPTAVDPFRGTSWALNGTETNVGNSSSGSSARSKSDLVFSGDGHFTLAHHCYSEVVPYTVHTATITISADRSTRAIPCPSNAESAAGQKENDVVDAILAAGSATFTVRNGELTLSRAGHAATFTSQGSGAVALRAAHWQLGEIHKGGASLQPSAAVEFDFGKDVVAAGENHTARATITDTSIYFQPWFGTGGGVGLDAPQTAFVYAVLTGTTAYAVIGDKLTITKAGVGALVFTKMS